MDIKRPYYIKIDHFGIQNDNLLKDNNKLYLLDIEAGKLVMNYLGSSRIDGKLMYKVFATINENIYDIRKLRMKNYLNNTNITLLDSVLDDIRKQNPEFTNSVDINSFKSVFDNEIPKIEIMQFMGDHKPNMNNAVHIPVKLKNK